MQKLFKFQLFVFITTIIFISNCTYVSDTHELSGRWKSSQSDGGYEAWTFEGFTALYEQSFGGVSSGYAGYGIGKTIWELDVNNKKIKIEYTYYLYHISGDTLYMLNGGELNYPLATDTWWKKNSDTVAFIKK